MTSSGSAGRRAASAAAAAAGRLAGAGSRALTHALGGAERTRIILLLASVLALSSADASTVGASARQLRDAFDIGNTEIGLLVTTYPRDVATAAASGTADALDQRRPMSLRDPSRQYP